MALRESPGFRFVARLRRRVGLALTRRGRRRAVRGRLAGQGLELGALHDPFELPRAARATYVDRLPTAGLRQHYPELAHLPLVEVDLVDDAETLTRVAAGSQDFVIASHLLEHCEDPLGALANWIRVLKPGGVLLLAVPDRRFTFDRERPLTSWEHVARDHSEGPAVSRREHYREWVSGIEKVSPERIEERARELEATRYSIHFHVWDAEALSALLTAALRELDLPARILELTRNRAENLALLERVAA